MKGAKNYNLCIFLLSSQEQKVWIPLKIKILSRDKSEVWSLFRGEHGGSKFGFRGRIYGSGSSRFGFGYCITTLEICNFCWQFMYVIWFGVFSSIFGRWFKHLEFDFRIRTQGSWFEILRFGIFRFIPSKYTGSIFVVYVFFLL